MSAFLVIGGSSGIGKALVTQLAGEGKSVFATYRQHRLESTDSVFYHYLDVNEPTLSLDFLPAALSGIAFCPGSINLLPFSRLKPQDFLDDYNSQVVGAIKVLHSVLPRLKAAGNASVVLFSTVAVQTGFPFHTQVSASKGAIEGLTRALAAEWAPSIRVNAIAPSIVETPLAGKLLNTEEKKTTNALRHPLKRIGTTDDIASVASFLLSDKSSWITGQVLTIDGGISSLRV